jgi:hypothetical protein
MFGLKYRRNGGSPAESTGFDGRNSDITTSSLEKDGSHCVPRVHQTKILKIFS